MTKRRPVGSLKQALLLLLGGLGSEAAVVAGKSLRRLHEYSDPDEADHPPVDICLALDAAARAAGLGTPMLDAYRLLLERAAGPAGDPAVSDEQMLLGLLIATGDLAEEQQAVLADGAVCALDRERMHKACAAVRGRLDRILLRYADPTTIPGAAS